MKVFFSLLVASFLTTSVFAADDIKLTLCLNTTYSLTINEIVGCNDLLTNHQDWTVKSFTVSFEVSGTEYNYNVTGFNFTQQIHQAIQSLSPSKIVIDRVVIINASNYERKMGGIDVTVVP